MAPTLRRRIRESTSPAPPDVKKEDQEYGSMGETPPCSTTSSPLSSPRPGAASSLSPRLKSDPFSENDQSCYEVKSDPSSEDDQSCYEVKSDPSSEDDQSCDEELHAGEQLNTTDSSVEKESTDHDDSGGAYQQFGGHDSDCSDYQDEDSTLGDKVNRSSSPQESREY